MAVWYEVEKNTEGIYNFLECNWCFHDFWIDKIEYHRTEKIVEIFMKYDELKGSVILRFINVRAIGIVIPEGDYDAWLAGSALVISENGNFTWIAADCTPEQIEAAKEYATWLEAERIIWAVTDEYGKPAEMPADKIDQDWLIYGKAEHHHFNLKPFSGDSALIKDFT